MIISIKSRKEILYGRKQPENVLYGKYITIIISKTAENDKNVKLTNLVKYYRLLVVVSKKIHLKAVVRNKIRRRIKNAFTKINLEYLQNKYDYQIIAKNLILKASFQEIINEITFLLKNKTNIVTTHSVRQINLSNKIKTSIALNMNKINKNCIFCYQTEDIIYETENFYVKVGKAIITPGHVMIIPKKHFLCIADIDSSLYDEYFSLKELVIKRITDVFAQPFLVEHGIFFQSVFHAHIHLIPTSSPEYSYVDPIKEFVNYDRSILNTKLIQIKDFYDLVDYYKKNKIYLYYEIDDRKYILQVYDNLLDLANEKNLGYRGYFSKIIKGVGNWKDMTLEEQENDKKKVDLTKKLLIF